MTATAAQIAQLRRMVNEPGITVYSDAAIQSYIEAHPLMDETGTEAYYWDYATTPPTRVANTDWIANYDLNAAAADIWAEKASIAAQDFDLKADGGEYLRSQVYEQAMKMSRHFNGKRHASTVRMRPFPRPAPRNHDEDL